MFRQKDNERLLALCAEMKKRFGEEAGARLSLTAEKRWAALSATLSEYPDSLQSHLLHNIFPAMAVFDALVKEGKSRQEAAVLTDEIFSACMEKYAESIRRLCKVPGLYRLIPRIFGTMAFKLFRPDAGFAATLYETKSSQARFDMTACPYFETCRKLGYPEIAPVFCHSDDICYGNMHRKLKWNRTKTLARGGDLCDFDLYIEK